MVTNVPACGAERKGQSNMAVASEGHKSHHVDLFIYVRKVAFRFTTLATNLYAEFEDANC